MHSMRFYPLSTVFACVLKRLRYSVAPLVITLVDCQLVKLSDIQINLTEHTDTKHTSMVKKDLAFCASSFKVV